MYALKNAKDVSTLKAVSQNLMHENLTKTDGVYGVLSLNDVKQEIMELSPRVAASAKGDDIRNLLSAVRILLWKIETD